MANVNRIEAQRRLVEQCVWLRLAMRAAAPAEAGYAIHRHYVEDQAKFDAASEALDILERCGRETLEALERNGTVI